MTVENQENINKYQESWKKSLDTLKVQTDPQVFAAFLSPLSVDGYDSDKSELIINAPSRLVKNHVKEKFASKLVSLVSKFAANNNVRINLKVNEGATGNQATPYVVVKKVVPSQEKTKEVGSSNLNPRYTFKNYVVGKNNEFCHAIAKHVAEEPGTNYNPLFIYGGVGLGKTHLLHAIGNQALEINPSLKVYYTSSENFTNELINSLRNGDTNLFKKKLRGINLLLIDDIQFIAGKERTQEEFFHTFNALYEAKNQIVITSDKLPGEIPGIEERLKTRFSWGITSDLQAPDFETRVAILNNKAEAAKVSIPKEVTHLIAKSISSNVRELEGAYNRLIALSSLRKEKVNLEVAKSALKELLQPKRVALTLNDIKSAVASFYKIKVSEMISKRRTRNLSFPRHIGMYLSRKHTTASYPEIGNAFGGRDHSSVIHAANVITKKIEEDEQVRLDIKNIELLLFGC